MKQIAEEHKISNNQVRLIHEDGTESVVDVIRIETRQEAIEKANQQTKILLGKPDAFDNLRRFCSDFSRHRNYEIESYLDWVFNTPGQHKIAELCPFNGFSWLK